MPGEIAHTRVSKFLLNESPIEQRAHLEGYGLYVRHGFPLAWGEGGSNQVHGFVVEIAAETEEALLKELDAYESKLYKRIKVSVAFSDPNKRQDAWATSQRD